MSDEQQMAEMRSCLEHIGKPFASYTTAAAVRDIEQVRRSLGYAKVNIWGGSYGTRLGQAYARAYPDSVRSLILDGVAAPEQIIPAAGHDGQVALDGLFTLCAKDPACAKAYPGLRSEFGALLARVASGNVKVEVNDPRTAAPTSLTITSTRFIGTVHSILYSPTDSRRLPFLLHSAYLGRWQPFLARSNIATDISTEGAMAFGLHLAVVCAEDVPRMTPAILAEDTRDSFLSVATIERITTLCPLLKVPAVAYQEPGKITVPVLMFSGALDPVTPPRRADSAALHMSHAQHLVVANAGHGVSQLGCAPRLMREFLDQPEQQVAGKCLSDIPAPTFQLSNAGPQP